MQLHFFRHQPASAILRHALQRRFCNAVATPLGSIKPFSLQGPWVDRDKLEACAPKMQSAEELRKLIEAAKVPPCRKREKSPNRKPDEMGRWMCTSCLKMLPETDFRARVGSLTPVCYCKECERKTKLRYHRTLRGGTINMCSSALGRARRHGLEGILTYMDLLDMLDKQGGKCAYSGVSMEVEHPHRHWRMSLERLDNFKGYVNSNCVLVAAEFNSCDYSRAPNVDPESVAGTAQWSVRKVQELPILQRQPVDLSQLQLDIQAARKSPRQYQSPRTPHVRMASVRQCAACLQVLPREAFYRGGTTSGMSTYCKDCSRDRGRLYYASLRGHISRCIGHARERARSRNQELSITSEHLLDLLAQQGGRCYYSQVPLNYGQAHTDWRLSVERLDNSIGYTPSNTVLIAVEFNTSDHSRNKAVTEVFGTAQWSREKVWHVWGPFPGQ